FFFPSRRRHTIFSRDWSSDVCSSDLAEGGALMTRVPILMYHSVTDTPNEETRPHSVRPGDLDEQLAYLAENGFTPLTLGDLVARLNKINGKELPDKPIVLTFDDGYADFHAQALPLLERHKLD